MDYLEELYYKWNSLCVFGNLRKDPVLAHFGPLLSCGGLATEKQIQQYVAFSGALLERTVNFSDYLLEQTLLDDNFFVRRYAARRQAGGQLGDEVNHVQQRQIQLTMTDEQLEEMVEQELRLLTELSQVSSAAVRQAIGYDGYLPVWATRQRDFYGSFWERLKRIDRFGFGMFAKCAAFSFQDGELLPIAFPDPIQLSDLKEYCAQRQTVVENTRAFLEGKPAANVLLAGDAGTGKSSTVKAVANAFYGQGLRLIELTRRELRQLPRLIDSLRDNPLKFLLFIDDLSFSSDDEDYRVLKRILEGSAAALTPNVIVYATSNRRHIVKESFSERAHDDVHSSETIQEKLSLSARFGLVLTFINPEKETYLKIVCALADQYHIKLSPLELEKQAERFALQRGGRSPRLARQFISQLRAAEHS